MTIAALTFRLAATKIILAGGTATAHLTPVHSSDPSNPNYSFAKSSPDAAFTFTVTNPDAIGFIVPDAVYDVVLVPRDAGYAISVNPTSAVPPTPPSDDAPQGSVADLPAPSVPPAATVAPVSDQAPAATVDTPPADAVTPPASDSAAVATPPAQVADDQAATPPASTVQA